MLNFVQKKLQNWLGITKLNSQTQSLDKRITDTRQHLEDTCKRLSALEKFTEDLHDLAHVGVDVHFKSPHMILVYTKLNGGQIHHIDAEFKTIKELRDFIQSLKARFRTELGTTDWPRSMR